MKAKIARKKCTKHGLTDYALRSDGAYRCKACVVEGVTRKRRRNKIILVEYLGGCCTECGYSKCIGALEFHHIDSTKKDFGLAQSGVTKSLDKLKQEVDKCILLCNRCHTEAHAELLSLKKLVKDQKYCEKVFEFLKEYKNYKKYENEEIDLNIFRKSG